MKNIFSVLGLCALLMVQGCTSEERPENKASVDQVNPGERSGPNVNDDNESTNTAVSTTEKAYICPMKCEGSASDTPGKCPVCKMDLVKNANYKGMDNNEVINHEPSGEQSEHTDDQMVNQPE